MKAESRGPGLPPVAEIRLCWRGSEAEGEGALWSALPAVPAGEGEWVLLSLERAFYQGRQGPGVALAVSALRPPMAYGGAGGPVARVRGVGQSWQRLAVVGITCSRWGGRGFLSLENIEAQPRCLTEISEITALGMLASAPESSFHGCLVHKGLRAFFWRDLPFPLSHTVHVGPRD